MDLAGPLDLAGLAPRALDEAGRFVERVRPTDLDGPTPCGDWTLATLLAHMVGHNHGWAAAARGLPADEATWEHASLGDDPVAAYRASVADVRDAYAVPDLMDRRFDVFGYAVFPARVALGMQFVDFLVHGWDVAKSIGAPDDLDPALCEAGLAVALRWPYRRPDKAFAEKVDVPDDAPVHHRLVAYLGRSPSWPRP